MDANPYGSPCPTRSATPAAARAAQNVPWLFKKRAIAFGTFRGLFCQTPKRAMAKRAMPGKTSLVFLKTSLVFLETCHETSLVLKTSLVLGCETSQATSLVLVSGQTSLVWVWHLLPKRCHAQNVPSKQALFCHGTFVSKTCHQNKPCVACFTWHVLRPGETCHQNAP